MVAAEYTALGPSIKIADLMAKETNNYSYIYPVIRVSCLNHVDIS
jgi:hypothetical protein